MMPIMLQLFPFATLAMFAAFASSVHTMISAYQVSTTFEAVNITIQIGSSVH
jgi:hypothetical protein